MNVLTIKNNFNRGRMNIQDIESLIETVELLEEENGLMAEKHAEKDMAIRGAIERIESLELIKEMYLNTNLALIKEVELYKLQEARLIIQNKKLHDEIKELKRNSRTIRFFEMAEENLRMAQEVERYEKAFGYIDRAITTQHCTMNHMENTEYEKGQINGLITASNIVRKSLKEI